MRFTPFLVIKATQMVIHESKRSLFIHLFSGLSFLSIFLASERTLLQKLPQVFEYNCQDCIAHINRGISIVIEWTFWQGLVLCK